MKERQNQDNPRQAPSQNAPGQGQHAKDQKTSGQQQTRSQGQQSPQGQAKQSPGQDRDR